MLHCTINVKGSLLQCTISAKASDLSSRCEAVSRSPGSHSLIITRRSRHLCRGSPDLWVSDRSAGVHVRPRTPVLAGTPSAGAGTRRSVTTTDLFGVVRTKDTFAVLTRFAAGILASLPVGWSVGRAAQSVEPPLASSVVIWNEPRSRPEVSY
jgi:hypothetical protein